MIIIDEVEGHIIALNIIVFDRIWYAIMFERNVSDVHSHKYANIKINSNEDFLLEKTLNMHNLVIVVKYVFNKNHNHCYYNFFF